MFWGLIYSLLIKISQYVTLKAKSNFLNASLLKYLRVLLSFEITDKDASALETILDYLQWRLF